MEEILLGGKETVEFVNKKLNMATNNIIKYTNGIKKNLLLIACELKRIKEDELYKEDGYTSVSDYASKVLGYSRANTSKLVNVAERFVEKGQKNSIFIDITSDGDDFTVGQLTEMLSLPKDEIIEMVKDDEINPTMTAKEIREQVKAHKEVDEENTESESDEPITITASIDDDEVESEVVDETSIVNDDEVKGVLKSMIGYIIELMESNEIEEVKKELNNLDDFVDKNI